MVWPTGNRFIAVYSTASSFLSITPHLIKFFENNDCVRIFILPHYATKQMMSRR